MSKMHKAVLPVVLLVSALALSACATKPKEEAVAEPAPVAAAAEQTAAPEAVVAEQPAPAAMTEEQAPKPVTKKARKKAAKAKVTPPKAAPVEPVAAPAPAVQQEAPAVVQPEPTPPAAVAAPAPMPATKGFLEQYWLWLLGIVIAVVAILFMMNKKD